MKFEKSIFLGACSIAASLFCFDAGAVIYIDNFLTQAGKDRINRMTSQELRKTIAEVTNISLDEAYVDSSKTDLYETNMTDYEKRIDEDIDGLFDVSADVTEFFKKEDNFELIDHHSHYNKLGNQCPILSLNLQNEMLNRLQGLSYKGTTLGLYMNDNEGLANDQGDAWNLIADTIESNIIIYSFDDNMWLQNVNIYKGTEKKSFDKIKRVALQPGHFVELKLK